jgi:hypothetical protein
MTMPLALYAAKLVIQALTGPGVAELGISDVLACKETSQRSVPIGVTTQIYDNRASFVGISPSLAARKTWRQKVEVDLEKLSTQSGKFTAGLSHGPIRGSFELGIQKAIKEAYTRSEEIERNYEQTLNFDVPAGVKLTVLLKWKQIWQDGLIKLALTDGQVVDVPFSIALEVSYDMETETSH